MDFLVPCLSVGLIFVIVAVPLMLGIVPPNYFYGFRVPKTVNNPDIWYPANKYCGWTLFISGVVIIAAGFVLKLMIPNPGADEFATIFVLTLLIPTSIALIFSFRYLRTL